MTSILVIARSEATKQSCVLSNYYKIASFAHNDADPVLQKSHFTIYYLFRTFAFFSLYIVLKFALRISNFS